MRTEIEGLSDQRGDQRRVARVGEGPERVFRQARLYVYQPGGATPYMQVELDDVMVKSTSLSGGSGEAPTESFALGSRRIRWTFPQVSTNGREVSRLSWGWNKDKNERF